MIDSYSSIRELIVKYFHKEGILIESLEHRKTLNEIMYALLHSFGTDYSGKPNVFSAMHCFEKWIENDPFKRSSSNSVQKKN